MKSFILALGATALILTAWTLAACLLARYRGQQIERWLREHEGREFPPKEHRPRKLAVEWEDK